MRYNMIVLDLDGTLTNAQKKITEYTKQTLFEYMEAGGIVVLGSGRPTYGVMPVAEELELSKRGGYILSYNGGNIIDCKTQEIIYQKTLDPSVPGQLVGLAKKYDLCLMTYENEYIITENPDDEYAIKESFINKMDRKKVDDFTSYVSFPVTKCLMTAEGEYLGKIEPIVREALGDKCNVVRSEPFFLEVMSQGIDKAKSLEWLLNYLGMSVEEMASFGDGFNDMTMIQYAGLGVAMSNAQPAVKEAADLIAPSNEEDGVAWTLKKVMLRDKLI